MAKKYEGTDKKVSKMTREGLTEENLREIFEYLRNIVNNFGTTNILQLDYNEFCQNVHLINL